MPLHPLLVAAYPSLALLAANLTEVNPQVVWRPLAVSVAVAAGLLFLLRLVLRDGQRAGLMVTLLMVLFFSYGHLYTLLEDVSVGGVLLFRHRTLLIAWTLIGLGGVWFIRSRAEVGRNLTPGLNLAALVLVIMPLVQVGIPMARQAWGAVSTPGEQKNTSGPAALSPSSPDIYYIILDAHGRADVLAQYSDYDSQDFLRRLQELGFYVAECSQANYSLTLLSLASSLNYTYLDDLMNAPGALDLQRAILQSRIRRFLEEQGYRTVAFASGFRLTEWTDADEYYQPASTGGTEFEAQLLETTLWKPFVDIGLLPEWDAYAENYRDRTLLTLQMLKRLPSHPGPKLVFAHIIPPHPPYIFDAQGNFRDVRFGEHNKKDLPPQEMLLLYRQQVEFIDRQILEVVRTILAESTVPPIIILQGDHGPLVRDKFIRMAILNAYYLPKGPDGLYPTISPVNTFRVILNEYFNQNLPLLDDMSRYSPDYRTPFDYRVVPNSCSP